MMHYRKGENIEKEIQKEDVPFKEFLPPGKDFLWMRVKGGTKVNNVVSYAKNALDKGEYRTIVWTGVGGGNVKTISCAEIIKRSHPLYQLTRMTSTIIEEHWTPQMEGLDVIVVKREIPCLHILMTLDEIDDGMNGVQKPNVTENFFSRSKVPGSSRGRRNRGEYRRKQNRNQAPKEKSDQRSEQPISKRQHSDQQTSQEMQENQQSSNPKNAPNSERVSGEKRRQRNRNPKSRDNVNASQASSHRQRKTPEAKSSQVPIDT